MEGHPLGEEKEQGQPEAGPSSSTLRLQAQTQLASRGLSQAWGQPQGAPPRSRASPGSGHPWNVPSWPGEMLDLLHKTFGFHGLAICFQADE